ncbi:unnamed protein product [Brassica oleracea var. botrytis]
MRKKPLVDRCIVLSPPFSAFISEFVSFVFTACYI